MTKLFIDGKEMPLPDNVNFEITIENPYFTEAGEYTSEVELDASAPACRRIFGHSSRLDVTRKKLAKDCRLVCNNVPIIVGTATTTEYSDQNIAVQLLGGNSQINFFSKNNSLYIDEMDLGQLVDSWTDIIPQGGHPEYWNESQAKSMMAKPEDKGYVMLPAWDSEKDEGVNIFSLYCVNQGEPPVKSRPLKEYSFPYSTAEPYRSDGMALQPRLTTVVKAVCAALGYEVEDFDAENNALKYVYLVNVRHTLKLNEMLPHWSVSEFFDEIQKFMVCVFYFDSRNKKCSIKSRSRYFQENVIYLKEVDDAFNADIEDETSDISDSNLLYENEDLEKVKCFDEDANVNSEVVEVESEEEMRAILLQSVEMSQNLDKVVKYQDHFYIRHIIYDDNSVPVLQSVEMANHLGSDWKKGEDADVVTLKIAPAQLTSYFMPAYGYDRNWQPLITGTVKRMLPMSVSPKTSTKFDIDRYVHDGVEQETNDLDIMRVAVFTSWEDLPWEEVEVLSYDDEWFSSGMTTEFSFFYTKTKLWGGWTYDLDDISANGYNMGQKLSPCLNLRKMKEVESIFNESIGEAKNLDTTVPHEFQFYDDISMDDINKTFVIRGKKYFAKQIVLRIDNEGIVKSKTGTFIPADNKGES